MSNEFRKNHYIPKAYLKGFALPNKRIYRLLLNPDEYKTQIQNLSLSQIGFKYDIYSIKNDFFYSLFGLERDDKFIEKNCFKTIENNIEEVSGNVSSNHCISTFERELICYFILFSILRHPINVSNFNREHSIEEIENSLKSDENFLAKIQDKFGSKLTIMEINERISLEMSKYNINNISELLFHYHLLDIALNPNNEVRKSFLKINQWRKFNIYINETEYPFITSNFPAFEFEATNQNLPSLIFPLNSKCLLEIANKPFVENNFMVVKLNASDTKLIDFYNYIIMKNSEGELYGSDKKQLEKYANPMFREMEEKKLRKLLNNT